MNINSTENELSNLYSIAHNFLKDKPKIYIDRLNFEFSEIKKQGFEEYWINLYKNNYKFDNNPNNLVLPWALGMVNDDPLTNRKTPILCSAKAADVYNYKEEHGTIPHDLIKDSDMPDIDIDCLPFSRDAIKNYAINKYSVVNDGYGSVCSVGTWQTFKLKLALLDVAGALGVEDRKKIEEYTSELPEEVDDLKIGGYAKCVKKVIKDGVETNCDTLYNTEKCPTCGSTDSDAPTIGRLLVELPLLNELNDRYPDVVKYALQLLGRVRNMGMHAGALIITDRPLYGNIPLAKNSQKGFWTSMWTEGRNTQLSKFGYIKWDVLGLKTLQYVFAASTYVFQNRGISFGKPIKKCILTMKDGTKKTFFENEIIQTNNGPMKAVELVDLIKSKNI